MQTNNDITQLLVAYGQGDEKAIHRLVTIVYDELRRIAHDALPRQRSGDLLNTTALVHEAFIKLVDQSQVSWNNRVHFFAFAARTMRHILVDHYRKRTTLKRGGGQPHVPLDESVMALESTREEVLLLDEALERLEHLDARLVQVVECRIFAGLTVDETSAALGMSKSTVDRCWRKAKAFLRYTMRDQPRSQ